ncbi:Fis family transcriptional regulator [Thioflexithrix psekupsensis]|uniref:Fis family transcriptional regulator n=2 Tax=Thioflexithrix psekupsensis TaxID=1570016 RepID=A0A251X9L4_9GAMM|nr:Fis family transcriptional regulator [Thioflexithrix psekupsensis]
MTVKPHLEALQFLQYYPVPAALLSPHYEILATNAAYQACYGQFFSEKTYCYAASHHYRAPCDQEGENCPLKATLETGEAHRVLHTHYTRHGESHVNIQTLPIRNVKGDIVYLLEVLHTLKIASSDAMDEGLVGRSAAFNQVLALISRVAGSDATVLLLGESGTGKDLIAQAIHKESAYAKGQFVPVDCSGLSETLFESELFGHEKGAFTGAYQRKLGLVEYAHDGTLFLDEIGDVPLNLQVKLLRLLETGIYRRVGSIEPQKANFRLICATHKPLANMVQAGTFRQDLYYRINVFPIVLPPLRTRREDIPLLCESLLKRIAPHRTLKLHESSLTFLQHYPFEGNIRELRNLLERASLLVDGSDIFPHHLNPDLNTDINALDLDVKSIPYFNTPLLPLAEVEKKYLIWAEANFSGTLKELAQQLGLQERTFYRKREKSDLTG